MTESAIGKEHAMIVAIDGPAGSGKSTVGRMVAQRIGFHYLDTGALYRAATLACIRAGVDLGGDGMSEDEVCKVIDACKVEITHDPNQKQRLMLDGDDVTEEIRTEHVTNLIRYVADMARARALCSAMQREIAKTGRFVCDGRDQGTEVFPDAILKIYLWASPLVRAKRRHSELKAKGELLNLGELERRIRMRDQLDMAREVGALRKAKDSIEVDSSELTIEQTVDAIYAHCVARMPELEA